jgi:hypothetical protein
MAKSWEVLGMLIPDGGYVQRGSEYEDIEFLECEPITKAEYEAGFAAFDEMKAQKEAEIAAAKNAVYEKLGLTAEEIAALLA